MRKLLVVALCVNFADIVSLQALPETNTTLNNSTTNIRVRFLNSIYKTMGLDNSSMVVDEHALQALLKSLEIGTPADHDHNHDHDHDHNSGEPSRSVASKQSDVSINKCYSADELMDAYGVDHKVGLLPRQFVDMCPAFVQQVVTRACKASEPGGDTLSTSTKAEKYGYGFLAVTLINLCSLLGIVLKPLMKKAFFDYLMVGLVALAAGTMIGDGVVHLLPQSLGLHTHEGASRDESSVGHDYFHKLLGLLAAIYAFFLLEAVGRFIRKSTNLAHGHSHGFQKTAQISPINDSNVPEESEKIDTPNNYSVTIDQKNTTPLKSNTGEVDEVKHLINSPVTAFMIIFGDSIHNLADGIAIGAAFSLDIRGGLSTSIAIMCHELPHELGDFAALISSGMSVTRALLSNLAAALTAYAGFFIGMAVAVDNNVRLWMFAVTAGMFLFIALAEMVKSVDEADPPSGLWAFVAKNVGILLGFGIMITIALLEHKIDV